MLGMTETENRYIVLKPVFDRFFYVYQPEAVPIDVSSLKKGHAFAWPLIHWRVASKSKTELVDQTFWHKTIHNQIL